MKLVIVESPAKARTIEKILGGEFKVQPSLGHVKDLPRSSLAVKLPEECRSPEEAFEPKYVVIKGKRDVLKKIKELAGKAEVIYLATDPDREGEAIAWHIAEEIRKLGKDVLRAEFIEITPEGIKRGIEAPRELDEKLFNAQKARRVLDRLVGYLVSPLLWEKVKRGLSAGRVQTVALRLIVEREKAIREFKPEKYYVGKGLFRKGRKKFEAALYRFNKKDASRVDEKLKEEILPALASEKKGTVVKVEEKTQKVKPQPPFTTSKLQQEASIKFGFTPDRTMRIAQMLYEGVELEIEGRKVRKGLITYMRTDSTRVAPSAVNAVREYISSKYGENYLPGKPHTYRSSKYAQEAHEAIRPTDISLEPELLRGILDADAFRLYELIYRRFVASQMKEAEYRVRNVIIEVGNVEFRLTSKKLAFPGFLQVYGDKAEEGVNIPDLSQGEEITFEKIEFEEKYTQPPPRYTDASLVKALEEKGIGRPSTYAQIIKTLEVRNYVVRDRRTLIPTELGILVAERLVKSFKNIFDVKFTARMEESLDKVEKGEEEWKEAVMSFYTLLNEELSHARENMENVKLSGVPTDIKCEKCGSPMNIRSGRFGEYLQCSNPDCGEKKEFVRDKKGTISIIESTSEKCELCGSDMILRSSKKGKYYMCTNRECTNFKLVKSTGEIVSTVEEKLSETCPECGSPLLIRRSRKGVRYVSCSSPSCKYTRGYSEGKRCPECGGLLVERRGFRGRLFWGCENYPECKYVERGYSTKKNS